MTSPEELGRRLAGFALTVDADELGRAIAAALRSYGDGRAAQERERIINEIVRPLGWRDDASDAMRIAVTTIIAAIRALS